jgi:hypothetical protein
MEFLLLILVVPAVWLFFLPSRVLRRAGQLPMIKPAIVGAIVLVGWAMLTGFNAEPAAEADYARSDSQLRALLE